MVALPLCFPAKSSGYLTKMDNKNKILGKKIKVIMLKVKFKLQVNGITEEITDLGMLKLLPLKKL